MTRSEFLAATARLHIAADAYDLAGAGNECYALASEGGRWSVYYSERGHRNDEQVFSVESAALEELLRRLENDPTTRGSDR